MSNRTNDDAGLAPGVKNSHQENIVAHSAANVSENKHIKPERTTELAGVA